MIRVGTAGWSIPPQQVERFPEDGSHLERYAARLSTVEVNSSFYRPHRPQTYARWAATVPAGFRFAVKLPREITHGLRLVGTAAPLERFLAEATALGDRLGPLLVQLPPSLRFDESAAAGFLELLRQRHAGGVALEPRHRSWFDEGAERLLERFRVARVAADPAVVPAAAEPGGWPGLVYRRLHGSPRMYYSGYGPTYLQELAGRVATDAAESWCIFDNTALGEAAGDALDLVALLSGPVATTKE